MLHQTDIKIEKNVPVPSGAGRGRNPLYPFTDMEIGDSFALPLVAEAGGSTATNRVNQAASQHSRRHGAKFTVRTLRDEGIVRCWRVA